MAQIGRVRGARPGPVEVLCASGLLSSQSANAVCMVAIALAHGPQTVLRVSSLPRLRTGSTPKKSELLLGALPSKEDRCGLSWLKLRLGSWTMVIWTRTGVKIGISSEMVIVGPWHWINYLGVTMAFLRSMSRAALRGSP